MPNNQVMQIFRSVLGRDPNASELQIFSDEISSGRMHPIGLQNFLMGSTEYSNKQIPQSIDTFSKALEGRSNQYLDNRLQRSFNQAQARFRQLGRSNSSGLASSFAQAGANASADLAKANFGVTANMLANYFSGQAANQRALQAAGLAQREGNLQRSQQKELFDLQREFLIKQGELNRAAAGAGGKAALGGAIGKGVGLGAGALAAYYGGGSPLVGAMVGSGLGQGAGGGLGAIFE